MFYKRQSVWVAQTAAFAYLESFLYTPIGPLEQGCHLLSKSSAVFSKKRLEFFKSSRLLNKNRHLSESNIQSGTD